MPGPRASSQCPKCHLKRCECKHKRRPIRYTDRRRIAELLREEGFEKKADRFRHCHMPNANDQTKPMHPGGVLLICPDMHEESAKYHPYCCGVVGCPLCSRFASARLRNQYENAMIALHLAREQTSWHGRFWFVNLTYKVDEGEAPEKAINLFHASVVKLCNWIIATYGKADEDGFYQESRALLRKFALQREGKEDDALPFDVEGGGYVFSTEAGPKGLEEIGEIRQIHGHGYLALPSETQIGRWIPKIRKGLSVGSIFSVDGDKRKEAIERKWCELVEKETPVSRIYEIAPRGLALKFDRADLEKRLSDLGLQGDELEKAINYNMRATIASAASEILKYATKAYNLEPEAFVEVVKAFDRRRRVFSGGVFFGGKKSNGKRWRLAKFYDAYAAKHGDPLGREIKPKGCPICGKPLRKMAEADAERECPGALAAALKAYLSARRWLDTGDNSGGSPPGRPIRAGPPWLLKYWAELEALKHAPKAQPAAQSQPAMMDPGGEALPVRVAAGVLAYPLGL